MLERAHPPPAPIPFGRQQHGCDLLWKYYITGIRGNSIIDDINEKGPDLLVSLKVIIAYSNMITAGKC